MSRIYTRVHRVADWTGWCSPCSREDRPLVLTRSGAGGVQAWLTGFGDEDRILLLTCRVCGGWQFVPAREEDDPEVVLVEDVVVAAVADLLSDARAAVVPLPRAEEPPVAGDDALPGELVAGLFAELSAVARIPDDAAPPAPPAAPAPAPAAVVPAPRPAVPGTVPVPAESVTLVAYSSEAVATAAPALPAVLGLPAGTRSVVLATAS